MKPFVFSMPTEIRFGWGVAKEIGEAARQLGGHKALIVTDKGIEKAGLLTDIVNSVHSAGVETVVFTGVEPNPRDENVAAGAALGRESAVDMLIAVGGGSSIDAAKGINVLLTNGGEIKDYRGVGLVQKPTLPFIAVPTTAGTGAEVTRGAVITDTVRQIKIVVVSPFNRPKIALVDPSLTVSLPARATAETGMDALTHAIETYVSLLAQPMTDALALAAIELIANNLGKAVANGADQEARSKMMLASMMAGVAFSHALVGTAHSLAHPLSTRHNLPHGLACSIMLPYVMEFNLIAAPAKYAAIARAMGEHVAGLSSLEQAYGAVQAVRLLASSIDLPTSLQEVGLKKRDLPTLIDDALEDESRKLNSRVTTRSDIECLYGRALSEEEG
ncbi:MAG: iron-containing alcohol dehydrogenase [Chloroflexi bacterium]|nr:iron-containing alcohol dehydrogenase [Chloroflexota bacterium]